MSPSNEDTPPHFADNRSSRDGTTRSEGDHSIPNNDDQNESPTCRICLCEGTANSDVTDPNERLISPCLCRGTIRHVHIACLQQWRLSAHGRSDSALKCDQCGHKYDVRQTSLALFLMSDRGALALTVVGLGVAVHVLGILGYMASTEKARIALFNWLRLGYHRESRWLVDMKYGNILTLGGTAVGFITFALYSVNRTIKYYRLYRQGVIDAGRFQFTVLMLGMWIHREIILNRSGRGLAVVGLFMACYHSYGGAVAKAKHVSQWMGETILEPAQPAPNAKQAAEGDDGAEDTVLNPGGKNDREFISPDATDDSERSQGEGLEEGAEGVAPPTDALEQLEKEIDGMEPVDEPADGVEVARVQIRMPDGKRIIREFRGSDPVKVIYSFVAQSNDEDSQGKDFELRAGFPPRNLLTEVEKSISSCDLAGEALIARWK